MMQTRSRRLKISWYHLMRWWFCLTAGNYSITFLVVVVVVDWFYSYCTYKITFFSSSFTSFFPPCTLNIFWNFLFFSLVFLIGKKKIKKKSQFTQVIGLLWFHFSQTEVDWSHDLDPRILIFSLTLFSLCSGPSGIFISLGRETECTLLE